MLSGGGATVSPSVIHACPSAPLVLVPTHGPGSPQAAWPQATSAGRRTPAPAHAPGGGRRAWRAPRGAAGSAARTPAPGAVVAAARAWWREAAGRDAPYSRLAPPMGLGGNTGEQHPQGRGSGHGQGLCVQLGTLKSLSQVQHCARSRPPTFKTSQASLPFVRVTPTCLASTGKVKAGQLL